MLPNIFCMPPTFCSYAAYAFMLMPVTAATPAPTAATPTPTALAAVAPALPSVPTTFEATPSTLPLASSLRPTLIIRSRRFT
nr:MAG: hypothetical protein [Bacteriophage sp.]